MRIRFQILLVMIVWVLPSLVFARKLSPEIEYAMGYGAETKICLKVCDDEELPVSNASVRVEFDLLPDPYSVYGKTDSNGVVMINGKTNGNKIRFFVGKDGYYGARRDMTYVEMGKEHDVEHGKWQPYGDEVIIPVKQIKEPVALRSSQNGGYKYTDAIGKWIGYDLEVGDFVDPIGKGLVADFEVYLDWDGKYFPKCERIGMKIRFKEPLSGYYSVPLDTESELQTPYSAMPNAVFSQVATYYDRLDGKRLRNKFDKSKCWIIRSRCKIDSQGSLVSANYSVARYLGISGSAGLKAGFSFWGAFNPLPNDTNLEDIEIAKRSHDFVLHCEPPPASKGSLDKSK